MNTPSGTLTFLFTDIEGSTQLWEKYPEAMKLALARHDVILRQAIEAHAGHVFKTVGDAFCAAFPSAPDAVSAALDAQRALVAEIKGDHEGRPYDGNVIIRVRMGLHSGVAEMRDNDYFGPTLNRVARLMSAGHGGQILLSDACADLVREQLPVGNSLLELGEYTLKGLAQPEKIHQLVVPDLQKDFPALNAITATNNNLPAQLTSFIGRKRELQEAKEKLEATRLLTLIGPGGTGKTRLSIQLGVQVLPDFADGVWLVELAPLADPAFILQTIASVLNLRAHMGLSLKDAVVDYLRAKSLLLILDNCEHLVEACAQLADELLRNAPRLKIIASSREALGIHGETVYRLASLSLPGKNETALETLQAFESIQLFIERGRAVNPRCALTEKSAASIAQICRRLDGIPLALELAAARVSVFSVEQIAARLDDRFKLLTGGSRTALPRQQTLRAMIDWSYDTLREDERALLRRLSVFAGGWTFEAAEALCPDLDVLSLLTQLVNKSLVVMDDESGEARYDLLETIRQYARDKLLEAGEAQQARTQHLGFFLKFVEQAAPELRNHSSIELIGQFEMEYDNLRVAFEWALDRDVNIALHFVRALTDFWFRSGHGTEGIQWVNDALARANGLPEAENEETARQRMSARLKALNTLAWLCYAQGDNTSASKAGAEGILLARFLGDQENLTSSLTFYGSSQMLLGNPVSARASLEEAVLIARESKRGLGMALGMLAMIVSIVSHDFATGKAYEEEALSTFKLNEKTWDALLLIFGAARGAMLRGEYDLARERFLKVLLDFQAMGDGHRVNMIYSEFAHMDRYEGKYQAAEAAYRKTIIAWQKLGHRAAIAHQLESFAFIAKIHGQAERATRLFGAAEALREKINIPMSPHERAEYDTQVAELRAGMDEQVFTLLHAAGRAMSMDEAIALALEFTHE